MSDGSSGPSQDVVRSPSTGRSHPIFHFVAGLASGLGSAIVLQPVDLLKTRVQQSRSASLLPVLRSILTSPNPIASLWRGTLPSAIRTGFGSALYFTSLSALRQTLANAQARKSCTAVPLDGDTTTPSSSVLPRLSNTQNLATGAAARVFAGLIIMPITVLKVRYESDMYAYRSLLSASRDILRREGGRGFFTGFGTTAIRDGPYAGLYVVFYEWSKKQLNLAFMFQGEATTSASAGAAAGINFTSGVAAAGLATAITNPFDAVKTRLQLIPAKYQNMARATRAMLKEDGVRSFFNGLGLRMSRKALSSALAWTVYEDLIARAERRFAAEERARSAL